MAPARVPSVSLGAARAFRMRRHCLTGDGDSSPLGVVRAVCGIQAQVPAAADLAVATRAPAVRPPDLEDLRWQDRSLVRTWAMRGTLHELAAEDVAVVALALADSGVERELRVLDRRGHERKEVDRILAGVVEALADGPLTRDEIATKVGRTCGGAGKELVASSWGLALKPLSIAGRLCCGPPRDGAATFVLSDRWLQARSRRPPSPAEATRRLLVRYLAAYGPAAAQDFGTWSGIPMRQVQEAWSLASDDLLEVDVAGRRCFVRVEDEADLRATRTGGPPQVRLLPRFDAFVLGHRDKGQLMDESYGSRVFGKAGWIAATLLVDGEVRGVWSHARRGKRVVVTVEPFRRLTRQVRESATEAAAALGGFWSLPVDVRFEEPTPV